MAEARALVYNQVAPPQQNVMGGRGGYAPFEIYTNNTSAPNFSIVGSEFSQVLEIMVAPGETVTTEPGTMVYMTEGMKLNTDIGGCGQGCKRACCAGESFFRLKMVNETQGTQKVGVSAKFPAKVVPINLAEHSGMIFNRGAFLSALGTDWRVDLQIVRGAGVCCCAGQGLFMNTLSGNGMAFLNAGGTVMTKVLQEGEELIVDPHTVLAFASTVQLGIRRVGGLLTCCCGGQGLFNATLTGPGFIMVHTMSLARLRKAVAPAGQNGNNGANAANAAGGA